MEMRGRAWGFSWIKSKTSGVSLPVKGARIMKKEEIAI
jgi:hypothetical protein